MAVIAFAVVAVPWHHAMLIRHGMPFWDELFGDNHWRRMVIGRHGDRGTFEYFLRELGYGMWPWVALAPAALGWAVLRRPVPATATATDLAAESGKQQVIWLGAIWFVSAYALVSLSMTKFHHYVLPAHPGAGHRGRLLPRRSDRAAAPGARRRRRWWSGFRCCGWSPLDLAVAQERRRALPLAVLLRLRAEPEGTPLAAVARFLDAR